MSRRTSLSVVRGTPLPLLVVAGAAVLATSGHASPAIRVPLGLALVLVLPGCAWLGALPAGEHAPLTRGAMIIATSLGITMVLALGLNLLPGGLTDRTWSAGLAVVVAAGVLVTRLRRSASPVLWSAPPRQITRSSIDRPAPATVAKLVVITAAVAATIVISIASQAAWTAGQHFTVLSVSGTLGGHPATTIVNHEGTAVSYSLAVSINGRVASRQVIRLRAGGRFSEPITTSQTATGPTQLLEITLDRPGRPAPYRAVWLRANRGAAP